MLWIFAAIAACLLLFAAPLIRNIGFAVLGTGFVVFMVIVVLNRRPASLAPSIAAQPPVESGSVSRKFDFQKYRQEKKDSTDPEAGKRIGLTEIRFDQLQPISGIEQGTIQSIRARLYNDSAQFTLTDYSYYLVVKDCLPAASDAKHELSCTTVFDQRDSLSTSVPAGQARDVVLDIPKDPKTLALPFKLLGTPRIELTATSTRAYRQPEGT